MVETKASEMKSNMQSENNTYYLQKRKFEMKLACKPDLDLFQMFLSCELTRIFLPAISDNIPITSFRSGLCQNFIA